MDNANATNGVPAAMEAIDTLALAASEAPVIDIISEDRATEHSIQAGVAGAMIAGDTSGIKNVTGNVTGH
eukprot:scaffold321552_cov59-Attheya_sp.AAC.1